MRKYTRVDFARLSTQIAPQGGIKKENEKYHFLMKLFEKTKNYLLSISRQQRFPESGD
jgi:hypothetical protein